MSSFESLICSENHNISSVDNSEECSAEFYVGDGKSIKTFLNHIIGLFITTEYIIVVNTIWNDVYHFLKFTTHSSIESKLSFIQWAIDENFVSQI